MTQNKKPLESRWYGEEIFEGKNVYFFIDADSVSKNIQGKLYEAAKDSINNGLFNTMFFGGFSGIAKSNFSSLEEASKFYESKGLVPGAIDLLMADFKDSEKVGFYGVESYSEFYEKFLKLKYGKTLVESQAEGIKLSLSDYNTLLSWREGYNDLVEERSQFLLSGMRCFMDKNKLSSAGLILDEDHFKVISTVLQKGGFGVPFFYPGERKSSYEDYLKHVDNLQKVKQNLESEENPIN